MKIKSGDLYMYRILTDGNTTAKAEIDANASPRFSNYRGEKIFFYKKFPSDAIDEFGEKQVIMTADRFIDELSELYGATFFAFARVEAPIIAFIESDKIAIKIFPQYNMN